jgi:hypothetical protein
MRGGGYEKCTDRLSIQNDDGKVCYCTMGLGCLTYSQATGNGRFITDPASGDRSFELRERSPYSTDAPRVVQAWLGLREHGEFHFAGRLCNLVDLNDDDVDVLSLSEIADIIEAHADEIFSE